MTVGRGSLPRMGRRAPASHALAQATRTGVRPHATPALELDGGKVKVTVGGIAAKDLGIQKVITLSAPGGKAYSLTASPVDYMALAISIYADGEGVLTATATPEANRQLLASGRICAIGKYQALGFAPWDSTNRSQLTSATFAVDMASYQYLNLNYLFYSCCTRLASVTGLGNLSDVRSMRFAFSSCGSLTTLDFRGFDPSTLTDLYYCFGGSSALTTIYADSTWSLPASGLSGNSCFYNCRSLVGGNGTAWSSSNTGYAYMRIDATGTPGYLSVA